MIKSFFAATALLVATASTGSGRPIRNRSEWFVAADDSEINGQGAATELHLGYEGQLGSMPFYIQGGPAGLQGNGGSLRLNLRKVAASRSPMTLALIGKLLSGPG